MGDSSQEEGEGLSDPDQNLAERYGSPLIKHTIAQNRADKSTGARKVRRTPSTLELARKDKQGRRSKHSTKYERQKERMDARAFKELDTTLQVLGIDGNSADSGPARVTASPHAPLLRSAQSKPRSATRENAVGLEPTPSLEGSGSLAGAVRHKLRATSLATAEPRRSESPVALLSRVSSRADSLADERQRWQQGLDDLLQGNLDHDDLQVALSLASGKANDLKEQLIYWQTPPEATWQAREERIEWLNQAMAQLRDVTIGLQQHGIDIKDTSHMQLYHSILKDVMTEMGNMTDMCCDAIVEGLQSLKDAPQDLHRGYRAACRIMTHIVKPTETKKHMQKTSDCSVWSNYIERTGAQCVRVLLAMIDATSDLQTELLQASSLAVTLGRETSAHEVSDRCKQLQFAWSWCAETTDTVARRLPRHAVTVNCAWCSLMLAAAERANEMQRDVPGSQSRVQKYLRSTHYGLTDDGNAYGSTGVWCPSSRDPKDAAGAVSDEELQAQAWLPACLTALLANAQHAATSALGCQRDEPGEGRPGEVEGDWVACQDVFEALSCALYELAVTGNHRIGSMCVSPSGLACWALELLEEQACQAVVFVRDLDLSVLGGGENGLTHYKALRMATDALVNAIFRVRRLLKQKRAVDNGDALPRPLPSIARTESASSLTAALRRTPAAQSEPNAAAPAKTARATGSGRPPLANGHSAPHPKAASSARTIPVGRPHPHTAVTLAEHSGRGARRQRSRVDVGTATPPILEDSDGENGHDGRADYAGVKHIRIRDERSRHHHRRRHRLKTSLRQSKQHPERSSALHPETALYHERPDMGEAVPSSRTNGAADHAADLDIAFADPFARADVQHEQPSEPLCPSAGVPLAVFPSADPAAGNSLMPAGSRKLFTFGSFSTSPSQNCGLPSPRGSPSTTWGTGASPFAAARPPRGVQPALNGLRHAPEHASSGGSSQPSTPQPVPVPDHDLVSRPTKDLSGTVWQARGYMHPAETYHMHPMSDPTNGVHIHLARRSGEDVLHDASPDSSGESHEGSAQNGHSASTDGPGGSEDKAVAFKLPWEGDPFWQISWESLKPTIVRKIGSGSFGQVFEVYYHSAPMAMKIINIDGDATALPGALLRFKEEVDLQNKLSHFPYIVRFIGACCHIPHAPPGSDSAYMSSNVTLAIVMELCRLGTLFKLIEWARKVSALPPGVLSGATPPSSPEQQRLKASPGFRLYSSWQLRLDLAKHAAAAVEFMHAHKIIHRDLTSYNLLVTDKFEAKVADFNLSRAMKGEMIPSSGVINSPEWAAPERLTGQRTYDGYAADVFSYGVILWELITLARPWCEPEAEAPESAGDGRLQSGPLELAQQPRVPYFTVINSVPRGERLKFPACADVQPLLPQLPQVVALAEDCWQQDPNARPKMTDVCTRLDAIIKSVKQEALQKRRA